MKKEDINYVFEQNPELTNVGTKTQYYKYLQTIFPESKVKDIVYHGSAEEFENFDLDKIKEIKKKKNTMNKLGIFFTRDFSYAERCSTLDVKPYRVLLDIKKGKPVLKVAIQRIGEEEINKAKKEGYDGFLEIYLSGNFAEEIAVFDPSQIHILGSKKDLEGFQKFVKNYSGQNLNPASLEKKLVFGIFVLSFLTGLFFVSSNITGNVIGNFGYKPSNILGAVLFLFGLLGIYIYGKSLIQ
ncbi:MAG: hypothetical protein WC812_04560 [Candidatus Pacearchaeota archaeon]|jgi:hypothetical protein